MHHEHNRLDTVGSEGPLLLQLEQHDDRHAPSLIPIRGSRIFRAQRPAVLSCALVPGPSIAVGWTHQPSDKGASMVLEPLGMAGGDGNGGNGDMLPGQPWPVPAPEPQPDGGPPPGDGGHRK
ncbi:hypothetical protein GCM10010442_12370 [Kitasatospora kifunensis]